MYLPVVSPKVVFALVRCRTAWLLTDESLGVWAHVLVAFVPAKIFGVPEGFRTVSVVMVAFVALRFCGIVGLKMFPAVLSASWSDRTHSTGRA